jgi:hypothetical protein
MLQAFQNFVGEPLRRRRFDLAWYRLTQLLHDRTNGAFDALYMRAAKFLRRKVALPASAQMPAEGIADVVQRLKRDGYMILPGRLSAQDIDAISAFAFSTPAHGYDVNKDVMVSPGNIPPGEARYSWWMHDLVRLPVVQRLIAEGPYCAIAQEYLGCQPVLAHITLFLDAPFEGRFGAYDYHYDNEGPGFLKFFFFLTDVEVGTGAHYFIARTQAHRKPNRFARATHYEEDNLFGLYDREQEIVVRGPAGTILAEDTAGFHRGSKIVRDYRLLMQVEFSVVDVPTEWELVRKLAPIPLPGLHPGIASIARKYFTNG